MAIRSPEGERIRRKVSTRILPILLGLYVMSYLDRTNVAFAREPMSIALGFSERVYGLGAGLFFIGYFLLGIPGALIVERWGARRLVGLTAIAWGLVTCAFALLRTPGGFYALRLLLGLTAAPFFPGVIVHIAQWFPAAGRSRALAGFMIAAPVSLAIGAPLSGALLQLSGLGLAGWQWIFALEGLLTVLLGFVVFAVLIDTPKKASWLDASERETLLSQLEEERPVKTGPWWTTLGDVRVVLMCFAHIFANIAGYGFIFWLPVMVKNALGSGTALANAVSALPFLFAAASMWLMARSSDRTGKWKLHACLPMLGGAFFFLLTLIGGQPGQITLALLCLTGACVFGWIPGFWAIPPSIATGPARAAAIGLINSMGNLGGFLGPAIIGALFAETKSPKTLVLLVSASYTVAACLVGLIRLKPPRSA